jgi:DNA gyrase subunit B
MEDSKQQVPQKDILTTENPDDKNGKEENFSSEEVSFEKIDSEKERQEEIAKKDYSSADIQVLKGLEPVRERPGMYIGTTSARGLHHLIREIVDNSVDEALAGYCHNIDITLEKDGSVTVVDDGRGIPVDIVKDSGLSGVETVYTTLHAGGKFEGSNGYKVSGGLHGVGASVVDALSSHVYVTVYRDGNIYQIKFENGGHTVAPGLQIIGKCDADKTGTTVNFLPDPTIFTETTVFQYSEVRENIRQTAYLNKGLSLTLTDLRGDEVVCDKYCFNGGISEYVAFLNGGKDVTFPDIIYLEGKAENIFVETALQPTKSSVFTMKSFCNNIRTIGGGTHEEGFRLAFGREMNHYFRTKEWLKEDEDNFTYDDLVEGLTVVISVKHPDPQYEGQVKDKLGNVEVRKIVSSIVGDLLRDWLMENPKQGRLFFERCFSAYRGRKAAERARNAAQGRGNLSGAIPDKLADCISKDPEQRELFIVEGNSAGGSAKNGRDAFTQAILPLRGKILNIEKAATARIEKNVEIGNMIQAIGAGYGDQFDVTKIKYHKVIIMTDADVDGSHIRILLLTFFYRFMKALVEGGYVYIAQPPLYKLTYQGHDYYCFKEEELEPLKAMMPSNARFALQRYKGLGEMDASQLAETTMEKEYRKMWRVTVQDAEDADNALTDLMGENVVPRKDYITANAKFVKNLDIN